MTDVTTTCVEVIFRVIGSGLCSPEKDRPALDYTKLDDQPTNQPQLFVKLLSSDIIEIALRGHDVMRSRPRRGSDKQTSN